MYPASALRRGFTLVELMVVILIIGMLLAMLSAALWSAVVRTDTAQITLEINQLDMALQQYKDAHGSYPPSGFNNVDFSDSTSTTQENIVARHLRGAFPSATGLTGQMNADLNTPAEALVFWLGGQYVANERRMVGFNANPASPFTSYDASNPSTTQRTSVFFEFEAGRLQDIDDDGFPEYMPEGLNQPFVYFAAFNNSYVNSGSFTNNGSTCRPYAARLNSAEDDVTAWVNPNSFQIISAGFDGLYGADSPLKTFPSGQNFDVNGTDDDNLTNFTEGTLGDERG